MKPHRNLTLARAAASRRGTALAMALIVVTVVAMMGAAYLQLTSSLSHRQADAVDGQKAFYVAEAGLAESFQAVRMGRTGQIGSLEEPAAFGQGILWVDAVEREDGSVRLDSNALCGRGRSSLSLVVEPVELALGFFADEDLVVDSVVLMDGFDSDEGGYAPATPEQRIFIDPSYPFLHDDPANKILFYEGTFYSYTAYESGWLDYDVAVDYQVIADDTTYNKFGCDPDDFTDASWESDYNEGHEYDGVLAHFTTLRNAAPPPLSPVAGSDSGDLLGAPASGSGEAPPSNPDGTNPPPAGGELGPTTGGGALLGSNGNVHFMLPEGESAEVWGDVQPGINGSVTGTEDVTISGETAPRVTPVELPEVQLPIIAQAATVRHDDLLPMLIPTGSSGFVRIEVAPDAELVIRGPATVLVDSLVLEPGALLTLDTRAGEVTLFVTNEIDLQNGASVVTSGQEPGDMSLQVSSTRNDPLDPSVKLDASAQFHGTVYAPKTDVRIGSEFEIFGGVVAERLDISSGARLHFDRSGFGATSLPRIIGWRVIEVPAAIKSRRDPFVALGVDKSTLVDLSEAHDLGSVQLDVEYVDLAGVPRTYSGLEDQFTWANVESVVKVERDATRVKETGDGEAPPVEPPTEPPTEPEPTGVRADVIDALATLSGSALKDALLTMGKLTEDEVIMVVDKLNMTSSDLKGAVLPSTPLGENALLHLLSDSSMFTSGDMKEILLQSSPLPRSVLDLVETDPLKRLTPSDESAILDANP